MLVVAVAFEVESVVKSLERYAIKKKLSCNVYQNNASKSDESIEN